MKYSPQQLISIVFLKEAIQISMRNTKFMQWSPEFYDKLFL